MNKSDIINIHKLSIFKFNNFASIMFWKSNIYRFLRDDTEFYSAFIDVPVRRYWAIALGD